MGIQRSLSMLGSAVSSSTPNDCQPNSHIGVLGSRPLMNRHAWKAPSGLAYAAVGMQRALDSAIGLPSRPTSASWMLVFLMPAEVRRSFIMPFLVYIVDLLDEPISDLKLTHYTTCGTGRRGTFVNTQFSRSYSAALLLGVRRADTRLMTVGDVSDSELRSL